MQQPHQSRLFLDSHRVATYLANKVRGRNQRWNRMGEKMYELCTEMRNERESFFGNVCEKLNLNGSNINDSSKAVMMEVFGDGCNFGRIIALYTFCLTLCEFCNQNELENEIDTVIMNTALTVYTQREWLEDNDSWDGLIDYFTKPEEKLWKGFFITTVGLGAVAGLLYVNS